MAKNYKIGVVKMIKAKTLRMRIVPAIAEYRQRVKGASTAMYCKGGVMHRRNGFGGEWITRPTRLILVVKVEGSEIDVCVDLLFREELGKLTQKRIREICKAVPAYVLLERNESFRGSVYYVLAQESFTEWLERMT